MSESKTPMMISTVWYKGESVTGDKVLVGEGKIAIKERQDEAKVVAEMLLRILENCFENGDYVKSIEFITKDKYEKLINGSE
jgi:hypothetical protein